jgi:hypothetical protein
MLFLVSTVASFVIYDRLVKRQDRIAREAGKLTIGRRLLLGGAGNVDVSLLEARGTPSLERILDLFRRRSGRPRGRSRGGVTPPGTRAAARDRGRGA